jgi:hypothetical protein
VHVLLDTYFVVRFGPIPLGVVLSFLSSGWHRRKLVLPPNSGLPSGLPSRQGSLGLLRRGIFLDRCNVTPTQMPELPILLGTP